MNFDNPIQEVKTGEKDKEQPKVLVNEESVVATPEANVELVAPVEGGIEGLQVKAVAMVEALKNKMGDLPEEVRKGAVKMLLAFVAAGVLSSAFSNSAHAGEIPSFLKSGTNIVTMGGDNGNSQDLNVGGISLKKGSSGGEDMSKVMKGDVGTKIGTDHIGVKINPDAGKTVGGPQFTKIGG